jgi:hypothetical protein
MRNQLMKVALVVAGCLLIAWSWTEAAPPAGGFTPIEQVVLGGCNFADSVALVRVSSLQLETIDGGERQTAVFEVIRMIKGSAADVPRQRGYSYSVPPETDSFPTRLKWGADYVMFLSERNRWIEKVLPSGPYAAVPVERVAALAESACQQPKINEAPA